MAFPLYNPTKNVDAAALLASVSAAQSYPNTYNLDSVGFLCGVVANMLAAENPVSGLLTNEGGTGLTTYTAGDTIYYASGTSFTKVGIGAAGSVYTSSGTAPQWSTSLNLQTAIATPSALAATASLLFASTVSGASLMGFGTTNDVTLMNQAGTPVLGIVANTTSVTLAGSVAIATAIDTTASLALGNTALTGTSQYGVKNQIIASAAATAALYGAFTSVTTFAGGQTTTNVYGNYIASPTKGAGSTITNRYGLYVEAVTGGATINYGIYVAGGTPGIYSATGGIRTDVMYLGLGTPPLAQKGITFSVTLTGATSTYGIALDTVLHGSGSTVAGYGVYIGNTTSAAGFTCTNFYGQYIDAVAKGAGSTITNRYGLYVVTPTDGGTLNRAIFVSGTGASEFQGQILHMSGTAAPATAGAVAAGAPIVLYSGLITIEATTNAPTHTRPAGSICINTGGNSGSTRIYINTTGSTTWTNFTTAA